MFGLKEPTQRAASSNAVDHHGAKQARVRQVPTLSKANVPVLLRRQLIRRGQLEHGGGGRGGEWQHPADREPIDDRERTPDTNDFDEPNAHLDMIRLHYKANVFFFDTIFTLFHPKLIFYSNDNFLFTKPLANFQLSSIVLVFEGILL